MKISKEPNSKPHPKQHLEKKCRLLALASDPTRMSILGFLFKYKEAYVSQIAQSLSLGITTVSHHLQLLRDNELLKSERQGNKILYVLVESDFCKKLEKLVYQ